MAEFRHVLEAAGLDADTHRIPEQLNVAQWLDHVARQYDVLVAAGGDGTVSTVAAATMLSGKTLGVLPLGTLNHFARDADIPTALDAALRVVAGGHTRLFDVGTVNGVVFINNASIGAYPRMVWERNRAQRQGMPRPLAFALAVLHTWLDLRNVTVHLSIDGVEMIRVSPFVFVGNSRYEIEGTEFGRRPSMTDGGLWLSVTPDSGRLDALTLPLRALLRRLKTHDKFETWQATEISMEFTARQISVALDGEIHRLDSPLRFKVQRAALRTIVAPRQQGES